MSFFILLTAGIAGGWAARRLRLPSVIGELCAGIALGPTLLGYAELPPGWLLRGVLVLYLFTAGLEAHGAGILSRWRAVLAVSLGGIVLPFAAGWLLGPALGTTPLLMATALSITALPVLARILTELKLTRTEAGSVALGAAAVDDAVGWSLFSLMAPAHGLGLLAAFSGGAALSGRLKLPRLDWLAPAYFASVGLRADFVREGNLWLCSVVLGAACATKLIGAYCGARAAGLQEKTARAVAFGMNARGAMEIVLAVTALEAGLIGRPLFVALVVMALVTSLMAGPALKRCLAPKLV